VPRFTTRNLVDVEFWDLGLGFVTAEGDIIYRTTDNGATWDSSYVQYIGGHIQFITRNCIWVVTNGRNLRSSDGGLTWFLKGQPYDNSWFIDSLNGWCSFMASVYRTSDAGQHWSHPGDVPMPYVGGYIDCLGFSDSLLGICAWHSSYVTPDYSIYVYGWSVTHDGGVTWDSITEAATTGVVCDLGPGQRIYGAEERGCIVYRSSGYHRSGVPSSQRFRDVSAARGDRAWVCGDGATIWSSADSGISWNPAKPGFGASFQNVDFLDSLHGWGASSDFVARTGDAGRSWTQAATALGVSPITDIAALGEASCLATAGCSYYDRWYGWMGEFRLGRTDNAGVHWDTLRDFVGGQVGSSRFARVGQYLWHPGAWSPNGNSLRSTDGGTTWLDMDTLGAASDGEPPDISFIDTVNGWVIDSRRNIRRTTNGGDSWTIIATGLGAKRLKMTSLTTGWAISDSELFETTDGGVNWQSVLADSGLQAIAFCDSSHGAIVGLRGLILRTDDAGQTWVHDSSEFTSDLYDVFLLDSNRAWAVGANGLVLGFGDWAIGVDKAGGQVSTRAKPASISVRPNPCRDHVTVELSRALANPARMTLVDVAGRVRLAVPVRAGVRSLELDLRSTPSGIYFLRAGAGPTARLVVQR
jgi:photosystem II stability/assembly factor-like uncharacterized protein